MSIVTAFDAPAAISESLLAGHKVKVCLLISGHVQSHKLMSALCQKRTFRHSFDHLVGEQQERLGRR